MFKSIKNLFAHRELNGTVLLAVVLGVALIGAIMNISSRQKEKRAEKSVENLLAAFRDSVRNMYEDKTYPFVYERLVEKEHIMNYAASGDTQFVRLNEKKMMYRAFSYFVQQDEIEQRWSIRQHRKKIAEMKANNAPASLGLSYDEALLELMEKYGPDGNGGSFAPLLKDAEEIDRRISRMENDSPGWRYVIEAGTEGGTVCRVVYIAPEDEPLKLKLLSGGIVSGISEEWGGVEE